MGRRPTPRTIAIRDQLLAILRAEEPLPLSTGQVLQRMGNGGRSCNPYRPTPGNICQRSIRPNGIDPAACPAWCWYNPVYPQLRALATLGLVEHIRLPDMRQVFWRYVAQESDAYFNAAVDEASHE